MNIETANRLLQYRKKHHLSQEELADKIGVSRQAVSKWERAEASPDTDNLILLSKIYGVTLDELLTQKEEMQDNKDFATNENQTQNTAQNDSEQATNQNTQNCSDNGNANFVNDGKDHVCFKNGIHIHSKDGDMVDIGFNGVHVHDKNGAKVDVDSSGVTVIDEYNNTKVYTDENGNVVRCNDDENEAHCKHMHDSAKSLWYMVPYPILITIAFLVWGFCGGWAISWILFLTIPLYYSLIDAVKKGNPSHFAYPVLVVAVYLWVGIINGIWHPTWILFITIPVYYCFCDMFNKARKNRN